MKLMLKSEVKADNAGSLSHFSTEIIIKTLHLSYSNLNVKNNIYKNPTSIIFKPEYENFSL